MQNAPPVVREHQEHIQDLKPDRRYRKEVDRNQGLHVIIEECPPGLGGRISAPDHILAHARLADVDAQLEQLAVNWRSAPEWVLTTHGANQLAHLLRHARPPRLTVSDLPGPEQAKAFAVPADDGRGFDDKDAGRDPLVTTNRGDRGTASRSRRRRAKPRVTDLPVSVSVA